MAERRNSAPRPPQLDETDLTAVEGELPDDIDLYRSLLSGDYQDTIGGGEIAESLIDRANLAGSQLEPLTLSDVVLSAADLSNAAWAGVTARRVQLTRCRTVGWRVICDFAEDISVEECRWDHGGFFLGKSRGAVTFRDCTFAGTTLRGDLSRVVFDGCDLAGAEFAVTAAEDCDLRTCRLNGARGLSSLRGARITVEQAIEIADLLATEAGFRLD